MPWTSILWYIRYTIEISSQTVYNYIEVIMSLFDFFRNKQAEVETQQAIESVVEDSDSEVDTNASITLKFGTESVEIPLSEVQGQTLIDVVRRYENNLGIDSNRVTSFRNNGITVSSSSVVQEPGEYSATINAMEKA